MIVMAQTNLGEGWQRRCICAVLVCLRAASEAEIAERCRRFYAIDPLDTSDQLRLLAEAGVISGVQSADREQLWELAEV